MHGLTIETTFYADRHPHKMRGVIRPASSPPAEGVPRIARLMALAIRMDRLVRTGEVANQAELARLGHVSRARITQIMNLVQLAPDIQEALLFLTKEDVGSNGLRFRQLQPIAALPSWRRQRRLWAMLGIRMPQH
jgi:hypothetical protein